jgi:hypothetical protein
MSAPSGSHGKPAYPTTPRNALLTPEKRIVMLGLAHVPSSRGPYTHQSMFASGSVFVNDKMGCHLIAASNSYRTVTVAVACAMYSLAWSNLSA